ncbi:hypothetical protein RHGRI_004330 [Rhododendron griersonianum]|uniref:Uncharacterized protein n=1 Tax=Rhododendron griersonianum TaxID=479676 RepID=A0AAV6L8L0_9ERIC|nr:hypothetical protein RHGRI_004330 [Rhododendron griersonianum]
MLLRFRLRYQLLSVSLIHSQIIEEITNIHSSSLFRNCMFAHLVITNLYGLGWPGWEILNLPYMDTILYQGSFVTSSFGSRIVGS